MILQQNKEVDPAEITTVLGPDIINGAAGHFLKFLETKEIVSGEDIVTKFNLKTIKRKVDAMQRDQIYALNSDIIDFILKMDKSEISEKSLDNVKHSSSFNLPAWDKYHVFQ